MFEADCPDSSVLKKQKETIDAACLASVFALLFTMFQSPGDGVVLIQALYLYCDEGWICLRYYLCILKYTRRKYNLYLITSEDIIGKSSHSTFVV